MSILNDYTVPIMLEQRARELRAESEARRLAQSVRPQRNRWWTRLWPGSTRRREAALPPARGPLTAQTCE